MLHVVIVAAALGASQAQTGLSEPRTFGAFELARNTLAYLAIVTASVVVIGARLAWAPVCAYIAIVFLAAPRTLQWEADVRDAIDIRRSWLHS